MIVIDGILLFVDERVRELCDVKVFVDADPDIRLIRRLRRDMRARGRPLDEIIKQYLSTVQPMHLQFVEPSATRTSLCRWTQRNRDRDDRRQDQPASRRRRTIGPQRRLFRCNAVNQAAMRCFSLPDLGPRRLVRFDGVPQPEQR